MNPSAFAISAAGADMPKRSMPKATPLSPTQRDQPKVAAASIDMRAVTSGGSTLSRYDCGCLAKSVVGVDLHVQNGCVLLADMSCGRLSARPHFVRQVQIPTR